MSDVIPFPRRAVAEPVSPTTHEDPNERLRLALARLEDALTRQRAAIAAWQTALGNLKTSVTGLGSKFGHLNETLDVLHGNVTSLHSASLELEARADRIIVGDRTPTAS